MVVVIVSVGVGCFHSVVSLVLIHIRQFIALDTCIYTYLRDATCDGCTMSPTLFPKAFRS